MLSSEPIFRIRAELAEILHFGRTPYGERRVIDITGGRVEGRRRGKILSGGADWQIGRLDGVTDLRARYTIETDAGGRVLVNSEGLRHGPPEVIERLVRTVMRFETADPQASWLNRILARRAAPRCL
jgi:hypothetical protein